MNPQATKIVVGIIKERYKDSWWKWARGNSYTDDAGNRIHVHDDSIVWESTDWLDYEVLDLINDQLEAQGIELLAEYGNSYEVMFVSP